MGQVLGQLLSQVLKEVAPLLPPPPPLTIVDPLDLHFLDENEVLGHASLREKIFFRFLASDQLHIKAHCNYVTDVTMEILNLLNLLMTVTFNGRFPHVPKLK